MSSKYELEVLRAQLEASRTEVERLTNHIRNTGIDDLEACLSVADGKCARLEAELAAERAVHAVLREALERELPEVLRPHVLEVADAQAAAVEESRLRHVNAQRARILAALAATPAPAKVKP